jgi:6,7-dimethyl-8-ribityllumazine synthase
VHLALVKGQWAPEDAVPVRVHEPLSVLDALDVQPGMHSWACTRRWRASARRAGRGRAAELRRSRATAGAVRGHGTRRPRAPRGRMDLRTYGVGAQILRALGVQRMRLLGSRAACPAWPASAGNHRLHHQGLNMLEADKGRSAPLDGSGLRIGIVQARFNESITNALRDACLAELAALGVKRENIDHHTVPGALEVPLALQNLADRGEYDALVALGCIIRGETYHFELVANESGAGVTRVGLDTHIPIANAILTTEDLEQAIARQTEKGRDAARVAVEMALLKHRLQ